MKEIWTLKLSQRLWSPVDFYMLFASQCKLNSTKSQPSLPRVGVKAAARWSQTSSWVTSSPQPRSSTVTTDTWDPWRPQDVNRPLPGPCFTRPCPSAVDRWVKPQRHDGPRKKCQINTETLRKTTVLKRDYDQTHYWIVIRRWTWCLRPGP